MTKVPTALEKLADLYRERNKLYGNDYKRCGEAYAALFPNGLTLRTAEDFSRFVIFSLGYGKQIRYANNFTRGGHVDSLDDLSVYAQMLQELDGDARTKPKRKRNVKTKRRL
jgi:hypothetical protein